jgi:hypothetical protein
MILPELGPTKSISVSFGVLGNVHVSSKDVFCELLRRELAALLLNTDPRLIVRPHETIGITKRFQLTWLVPWWHEAR